MVKDRMGDRQTDKTEKNDRYRKRETERLGKSDAYVSDIEGV